LVGTKEDLNFLHLQEADKKTRNSSSLYLTKDITTGLPMGKRPYITLGKSDKNIVENGQER
jgi:hypothetical protein